MGYEDLLKAVKHRGDIPKLLDDLNLTGHGAEVGVRRADYSVYVLAKSKLSLLFSVDSWNNQNKSESKNLAEYMDSTLKLFQYAGRSVMLRLDHFLAADLIKDESLDFVYYDIGYDLPSVTNGIDAWWPKVTKGGLFCGHIFNKVTTENGEVVSTTAPREALDAFLAETGLMAHITVEVPGRGTNSWIVRKPIDS